MPKPKTPLLTVDCVVFDAMGRVLMIRRKNPPFQGALALPGGFVDVGETVEAAAKRELEEETGVKAGKITLVGVYSKPDRDPRGHTCTVAFVTETTRDVPPMVRTMSPGFSSRAIAHPLPARQKRWIGVAVIVSLPRSTWSVSAGGLWNTCNTGWKLNEPVFGSCDSTRSPTLSASIGRSPPIIWTGVPAAKHDWPNRRALNCGGTGTNCGL